MDPPRRVALLARRRRIRREDRIDERSNRPHHRLAAWAIATKRRQGALHRLAHHPAMNAELPRHTLHRADAELVLTAQLLEQFHLRSPVHTAPRTSTAGRRTRAHTRRRGPTFTSTGGPLFGSEANLTGCGVRACGHRGFPRRLSGCRSREAHARPGCVDSTLRGRP